jgi:hypothetical protein
MQNILQNAQSSQHKIQHKKSLGVFAQQEIRNLFHNPPLTKFMT